MTDLPPLAAVSDLETRLGVVAGSLAGLDLARAQAALADVSALVRTATDRDWLDADGNAAPPTTVKVVTMQAALRAYSNPDNYTSESVGDYAYQREQGTTSIYLTDAETRALVAATAAAGGATGWTGTGSVRTHKPYAWPSPREFWWRDWGCRW